MTFHVIPWMWGVDGDKTVGISDTIRITDDGCESFFTLDEDFTVHDGPRPAVAGGAERQEPSDAMEVSE
jgi:Xaa-Pro dipeptidase